MCICAQTRQHANDTLSLPVLGGNFSRVCRVWVGNFNRGCPQECCTSGSPPTLQRVFALCLGVLDMALWLSCHHPSLLAKQPRQTQQHLFPVASGSLVFSPESSNRACFGVQLYRQWPSFFLRIRSPSSSGPNRTPQTRNTPCSMLVQVRALPISWVVGPSLAGNRPTARRAPSMGFGTKSSRRSAQKSPARLPPSTQ